MSVIMRCLIKRVSVKPSLSVLNGKNTKKPNGGYNLLQSTNLNLNVSINVPAKC